VALLALPLVCACMARAQPAEPTTCALEAGPTRAVTGVIDGETLSLDDGSEVRLIGALTPRPPDAALDVSFWPPEREAKAALEHLVLGRSVTLAYAGRKSDRYGRTLAHVFVEPAGDSAPSADADNRVWVQAHMLSHGHARAYVLKDSNGCLRELAAHEAIARTAGLGLWTHAAYQMRDGRRGTDIARLRSTFQIVEGEVTRVIEGRSNVVLRFGVDDTSDRAIEPRTDETRAPAKGFSVSIKTAIARAWTSNGLTLTQLEGRRLRIRGWIERRGGPAIEIIDINQIELVDPAAALAAADIEPKASVDPEPQPSRRRSRKRTIEASIATPSPL
jgi:micrococcal nuclease